MALNDHSLITVAELGLYVGISSADQTKYTTFLESLLNGVADSLEGYCDRGLKQHGSDVEATEYHDGEGQGHLTLRPLHGPVGAITSIHDDIDRSFGSGTLIASTLYVVDQGRNVIRLLPTASAFARGVQNIKLVYTHGYGATGAAAVPEDLKLAAWMASAYALKQSSHTLGAGLLGKSQMGREGESIDWIENTEIPAPARRILDRYRRVGVL